MIEKLRADAGRLAARLETQGRLADTATVRGLLVALERVVDRLVFRVEDVETGKVYWGSRLVLAGPFDTREDAERAAWSALEVLAEEAV